jgi:hypothetical protein
MNAPKTFLVSAVFMAGALLTELSSTAQAKQAPTKTLTMLDPH